MLVALIYYSGIDSPHAHKIDELNIRNNIKKGF